MHGKCGLNNSTLSTTEKAGDRDGWPRPSIVYVNIDAVRFFT